MNIFRFQFLLMLTDLTGRAFSLSPVSLNEMLSTCIDATRRGCIEIQSVERKRQSGTSLNVEFKDVSDPKSALTEADGNAQKAIVNALRSEWGPDLVIVGEEDDDESELSDSELASSSEKGLRRDHCLAIADKDVEVELSSIRIFVDPVDGTREFVEGRLENCMSLVGIAVDGETKAGVIGIPFPTGTPEEELSLVFGQVDAGYGVIGRDLPDRSVNGPDRPYMATGDATTGIMNAARGIFENELGGTNFLFGGAGNKILATALGYVDCTIQHKYGGPWDTCAPEAILRAMGGTLTDLNGDPLIVHRADAPRDANCLGFIGTSPRSKISHESLVESLKTSSVVREYIDQGIELTRTK